MRCLGFDPSLARTGWALVEYDQGDALLISCGVIKTGAKYGRSERLCSLSAQAAWAITTALYDHETAPHFVAYERGMAYSRAMAQGALAVAEARGVILAACASEGLETREVSPSSAKKSVTGNGRASKDDVREAVRTLFGLRRKLGEDESDAAAVALASCGFSVVARKDAKAKK